MSWVATAILGGGALSAASTAYAANQASSAQQSAAGQAEALQEQMFNETSRFLSPYRSLGSYAASQYQNALPGLIAPINMDEQTLQNTPGYQFQLTQGLKAVQNSAAARGLGESGAALKGASAFTTGLADSTWQQQFNAALANKQFEQQTLQGATNTGESAAAGTGTAAQAAGQGISSALGYGANAAAAGYNALGAAGGSAANALQTYGLYQGLYSKANPGGGGAPQYYPPSSPYTPSSSEAVG